MRKATSGGGITGNKNVKVGVRTGGPNKAVNKSYPGQLGAQFGDHTEHGDTGKTAQVKMYQGNALPSKLGNEVAKNVGAGGVGTGRTIHAKGSQGTWGSPTPGNTPAPRDILKDYGPDVPHRGKGGHS